MGNDASSLGQIPAAMVVVVVLSDCHLQDHCGHAPEAEGSSGQKGLDCRTNPVALPRRRKNAPLEASDVTNP
jgi:hypothetical protein